MQFWASWELEINRWQQWGYDPESYKPKARLRIGLGTFKKCCRPLILLGFLHLTDFSKKILGVAIICSKGLSTIENVASNFKYQHMIYLFIAAENYINK